MKSNGYEILIDKLNDFIKGYYKNQLIRGILLSLIVYLMFALFVSTSEYFGHFSITVRTIVFYTSISLFLGIFIKYILIPVLCIFKIGKLLSYYSASKIISTHFSEIQDKLQNILELSEQADDQSSYDLIIASIEQKTNELKPIPFIKAIDIKTNYKYLKTLGLVVLLLTGILIFYPALLTEGTERIIKHTTFFEPASPFQFVVTNDSLSVQKGEDFELEMEVKGTLVPDNITIVYGGNSFMMTKESPIKYKYTFKNINNPIKFHFSTDDYNSKAYEINVLPAPIILNFDIQIDVPEYTGETDKILKNIGDISVPCGTKISWKFYTKDADSMFITFSDSMKIKALEDEAGFKLSKKIFTNTQYAVSLINTYFKKQNIVKYTINVIPDLYPTIKLEIIQDSVNTSLFYYRGLLNDDYGFKKLTFNYKTVGSNEPIKTLNIPININMISQEFYYLYDFMQIAQSGEKIEYFFEVWDNDGVRGSKSTKTSMQEYALPSKEEIEKMENSANESIKNKIEESNKLTNSLKRDLENLQKNMINNNLSEWEKNKMLEQISNKQNQLEKLLQDISKENKQKNDKVNNYSEKDLELLEKQKQIQDLLENLMTDELKKLMEEFKDLMKDFDKEKMNELTKDINLSYDDIKKQLDRDLELLKKEEIEQKVDKAIDKLDKLSEDQKKLSDDVKEKNADMPKLTEEQQKQASEFEKLKEEYKEIQKSNQELQEPMKMQDFEEQMNEINKKFQQSTEEMKQENKGKASKKQKKNSESLKQLSEDMKQMMQSNESQQASENMDDIRQILDNLIKFSFDQEELMKTVGKVSNRDPKYIKLINDQKNLRDDYRVIKDSLNALSKRTPMLSSSVDKELLAINRNLNQALQNLEARTDYSAKTAQQFAMTSANNLALLLSEILESMQNKMEQKKKGDKQCNKPGSGKPSLSEMKSQQQSLKSQLESMIQQMKEGKGKNDGNKKSDQKSMNKKLAEMLAQQEMFQKMLNDMMSNSSFGEQTLKKLEEVKNLIEKNQNDLANKRINSQTLERHNQILTRLLEAEKSEQERETEKKRESKEPKNEKYSNPKEIFKYKGENSTFNELLNTTNIKLVKFYKDKYKEYLIKLNETN